MKEIIDKAVRGGLDKNGCNDFLYIIQKLNSFCNSDVSGPFFDSFIFSHEFLKAYFGDAKISACESLICVKDCTGNCKYLKNWQYHAQQLVLSEDREEYLRRYL